MVPHFLFIFYLDVYVDVSCDIHISVYAYIYVYRHICIFIQICMCMYICVYVYAYIYISIYIYIYIYIHIYVYIYTATPDVPRGLHRPSWHSRQQNYRLFCFRKLTLMFYPDQLGCGPKTHPKHGAFCTGLYKCHFLISVML